MFLGFELDARAMEVRLPQAKLQRIQRLIHGWLRRKACQKRELESLLGHLQHAATVVRPGRMFVRRLIELVSTFRNKSHWIRLNESTHSDIYWWHSFIEEWNGISIMPGSQPTVPPLETDASGGWGCGARWGNKWFQLKWEGQVVEWGIAPKELLPILFALVVWGRRWQGRRITCRCDNIAVVSVVNSGRAKDSILMHLLRCVFFVGAKFGVNVWAEHVPGAENTAADALSRDNIPIFMQVVPEAESQPTPIPEPLVELTVREQPDWTSFHWVRLFSACCRLV